MTPSTHNWLDVVQHLGYYISGFFVVVIGAGKLFWHQHKSKERRINNLEKIAEGQSEQVAELKKLADLNHTEHKEIMQTILKLHAHPE